MAGNAELDALMTAGTTPVTSSPLVPALRKRLDTGIIDPSRASHPSVYGPTQRSPAQQQQSRNNLSLGRQRSGV